MRIQDIRSTLRLMRTRPLFAIANVLLLALGLGATTAIFTVIHSVLLQPLPFPDSDRIVQVWESLPARGFSRMSLTEAFIWDIRDMNRSLVDYGGFHGASFTLTGGDSPQRVNGALVSTGFFRALGVAPVVGRLFAPGEDAPGAAGDQVMLSHGLWTTRFAADRSVVGRTIPLDGSTVATRVSLEAQVTFAPGSVSPFASSTTASSMTESPMRSGFGGATCLRGRRGSTLHKCSSRSCNGRMPTDRAGSTRALADSGPA